VEQKLHEMGFLVQILDGDNIRTGINSNLGFSEEDRIENIRRIAEVTKLFINCGVITINSFVSPTKDIRDLAQEIIGKDDFFEVFINASFEECEMRDVKGLYKKARAGEIKNFTGLDAPFEAPTNPALEILTAGQSIEASVDTVVHFVLQKIKLKK
jgi:adenylylsulfate kinase